MARLISVAVPLDKHGHHDLDAMADAAADAKVVVLCRPHNPTGTLESADVERFLRRVPPDTVLLDEAYIEFVAPVHRIDAPSLIQRFPNVVVLRTFSKAYGLAGLRIGYGFGSPELAKTLWTMQLPFGMSITSAVAVAASYDAEAQLRLRRPLLRQSASAPAREDPRRTRGGPRDARTTRGAPGPVDIHRSRPCADTVYPEMLRPFRLRGHHRERAEHARAGIGDGEPRRPAGRACHARVRAHPRRRRRADRVVTNTQGSADRGVGRAVSAGQHDPGAQHVAMLTADSTSPRPQQPAAHHREQSDHSLIKA
jgi:Aminotransferase class I and II